MAKIKHDHAVTQMALSNLDAWVNSPRVLSMIVCMVVYCVMQGVVDQGGFWVAGIELQLTLPEKLFVKLYNSFYNMGSLLFLVMVSEIPRRIPFQHMMLIRSTRRKWITSQCLYCALMVMLTILLLCMTYMLVVFLTARWVIHSPIMSSSQQDTTSKKTLSFLPIFAVSLHPGLLVLYPQYPCSFSGTRWYWLFSFAA